MIVHWIPCWSNYQFEIWEIVHTFDHSVVHWACSEVKLSAHWRKERNKNEVSSNKLSNLDVLLNSKLFHDNFSKWNYRLWRPWYRKYPGNNILNEEVDPKWRHGIEIVQTNVASEEILLDNAGLDPILLLYGTFNVVKL